METKIQKKATSATKKDRNGLREATAKTKAKIKAKRQRYKENKKAPTRAEVLAARRYDLMVGYDAILYTEMKNVLDKNNVTCQMLTDTYFIMRNISGEEAEKAINLVRTISYTTKHKDGSPKCVYKVNYVAKYKAKESVEKEKKVKKPSNNTADARSLNKCEKALKRTKIEYSTKHKSKRHLRRGLHSSGSNYTNYKRKTLERVKKACQYIAKLEAKKAVETPKKAKSKVISKVTQGKLKLAS